MAKRPAPSPAKAASIAAPQVEKALYYRIRKITGFLYEILEVEVDEATQPPKVVSKQDMKHLLVDKMTDFVCPHPDTVAKRKRDAARESAKADLAAKVIADVVAKVQE